MRTTVSVNTCLLFNGYVGRYRNESRCVCVGECAHVSLACLQSTSRSSDSPAAGNLLTTLPWFSSSEGQQASWGRGWSQVGGRENRGLGRLAVLGKPRRADEDGRRVARTQSNSPWPAPSPGRQDRCWH